MYRKYIFAVIILAAGIAVGRWVLPQSTTLDSHAKLATAGLCTEHNVDEALCTRCNLDLIPEFQAAGDWCAEHGVPETQCALCNADVAAAGVVPPAEFVDPHAGHDHVPDEAQGITEVKPYPGLSIVYRTNATECATDEAVITFASAETVTRAGITIQPTVTADVHGHFEAPAEVVFDQNETMVLSSSLPISIVRWLKEPGAAVQTGDPLALVESPDMAMLQGEFLESWSDWQVHDRDRARSQDMVARGLIDSASFERSQGDASVARARLVQSESRLSLAGVAKADLEQLRTTGEVSSKYHLRASIDGVLLERIAPLGRILEPGEQLARLGDPDALWIEGRVREREMTRVHQGQRVEFTADGQALGRTTGEVIWISSFLDPHTRTATVRVRPLIAGALRAHEFGRLHLPDGPSEPSVLVPRDAVQWEGCCNVVFVQEAPDRFRPRKVDISAADADHYRVTAGLKADEQVVVNGSFLLKTELKKSSIGAGCCGLEAT